MTIVCASEIGSYQASNLFRRQCLTLAKQRTKHGLGEAIHQPRSTLELLLHPPRGPPEQDHVTNEEGQHHEQSDGGHENDHEPDGEPGFHVEDATGRAPDGEVSAGNRAPRTGSYDSSEPARNSLR